MGGETLRLAAGDLPCRRRTGTPGSSRTGASRLHLSGSRGDGGRAGATAMLRGRWKVAGGAIVLRCCWSLLPSVPAPARCANQLELTAIDVGQGDSLLVSFPDGKLMVVDGGGIPTFGRRTRIADGDRRGRSVAIPLGSLHPHHRRAGPDPRPRGPFGGLSALMQNFHVRRTVDRRNVRQSAMGCIARSSPALRCTHRAYAEREQRSRTGARG